MWLFNHYIYYPLQKKTFILLLFQKFIYFNLFFQRFWGIIDKICIYLRCTMWWFHTNIHCEVITTIKLISIHYHSYNFFLVTRTFKIHSISNFRIYNAVLLTIITMLYITSNLGFFCSHYAWLLAKPQGILSRPGRSHWHSSGRLATGCVRNQAGWPQPAGANVWQCGSEKHTELQRQIWRETPCCHLPPPVWAWTNVETFWGSFSSAV